MLKVKLLTYTPNAEQVVASSAKLCYSAVGIDEIIDNLTEENTKKFLNMLMSVGHESPLEHVTFSFAIEGVSRSLTHQLVRHRIASYSQQSQRYAKESQFEYIIPKEIEKILYLKQNFIEDMEHLQKRYDYYVNELINNYIYEYLVNEMDLYSPDIQQDIAFMNDIMKTNYKKKYNEFEKKAIENARYVFPNAIETKIVVTMNARSLINFFHHRCCMRAQDEIREMANKMLAECRKVCPTIFKYAGAKCISEGSCNEGNMSCGLFETTNEVLKIAKENGLKVKVK